MKTCGSCKAGIVLMESGGVADVVQCCDECGLFESDADAAAAVQTLLSILDKVYRGKDSSDTVADAMDRLNRSVLRAAKEHIPTHSAVPLFEKLADKLEQLTPRDPVTRREVEKLIRKARSQK